jgi:predicted amidohydrolase YtcJ
MSTLLLRAAEVDGVHVDVRIEGARVAAVGPPHSLRGADAEIDCAGGALLPGLHDHHLHLLSMAAALESVDVSDDLDMAIRAAHTSAPAGAWIRAVNYDEGRGGALDRWRLDALAPGRPVRVQHRSGAMWVLNSIGLEQVGALETGQGGIARDLENRPTGHLYRLDRWLRARLPDASVGDLGAVGRRLASFGVTGVTDCTPTATVDYFTTVAAAVRSAALPMTVAVTGGPELSEVDAPEPLRRGPVKILITDHAFPELDDLRGWFERAHRAGRPVAVHCVSRAALFLALAAWKETGSRPGDRIEHASVTPPEAVSTLAQLAVTVVTQPGFIAARGDSYLEEVEPVDRPDLYRCASLLNRGVAVGGSTDAPFGPDDPWIAMRAAIDRRSESGAPVGDEEGLAPTAALRLFRGPLERPGGCRGRIRAGEPADLCLLDRPLARALVDPSSRHVVITIAGGTPTFMS